MALQKLKKISWMRRRFVASSFFSTPESWMDHAGLIKSQISTDSAFALVGEKTVIEVNSATDSHRVLIEVVGVPKTELHSIDFSPIDVFVLELPETIFAVDFLTLKKRGREIVESIRPRAADTFHIVVAKTKLELHFFAQKDYIQNRFS